MPFLEICGLRGLHSEPEYNPEHMKDRKSAQKNASEAKSANNTFYNVTAICRYSSLSISYKIYLELNS